MFVPFAVQWKILQCEEVLTALFASETQLEWVCPSPPPLIVGPLSVLVFAFLPVARSRRPALASQQLEKKG